MHLTTIKVPFPFRSYSSFIGALIGLSMGLLCFMCNAAKSTGTTSKSVGADTFPYHLEEPSFTINLISADLQEISGLSTTEKTGVLAAISDEKGEAYLIDATGGGKIVQRIPFKEKGDFEGIEMVQNTLYTTTSGGTIYEIEHWDQGTPQIQEYKTALTKVNNIEGLCFDKKRNALLLVCKENPDIDTARTVWAFDLKTKQLSAQPVYTILPQAINAVLPLTEHDKNRFFSPSGIAIHPQSGDLYIISSALKRLAVFDYATGAIKSVHVLDKQIMPQPEGICFDENGDLLISSEGKKGEGLLLRFSAKKK
jgi:uncharacterized protein YjiK